MKLSSILLDKAHDIDEVVVIALLGAVSFVAFSAYDLIWLGHAFSPTNYAIGFAGIVTATGLTTGGRDRLTRDSKEERPDVRPQ